MVSFTNPYPSWGDTGTLPPDGFQYEGGDQVREDHFDYLWNQQKQVTDDIISEFERYDSNDDGKVDSADTADKADLATNSEQINGVNLKKESSTTRTLSAGEEDGGVFFDLGFSDGSPQIISITPQIWDPNGDKFVDYFQNNSKVTDYVTYEFNNRDDSGILIVSFYNGYNFEVEAQVHLLYVE